MDKGQSSSKQAYQRHYYAQNRQGIAEKRKIFREKNRERYREQQRDYYWSHREAVLARAKKYRQEHPELMRDRHKKYQQEHPEFMPNYQKAYYVKHRVELKKKSRLYQIENRERLTKVKHNWRSKNPEKVIEYSRTYRRKHPQMAKRQYREYHLNLRTKAMTRLCRGKTPKCQDCGCPDISVLNINHKVISWKRGRRPKEESYCYRVARKVLKLENPGKTYNVLCAVCNWANHHIKYTDRGHWQIRWVGNGR